MNGKRGGTQSSSGHFGEVNSLLLPGNELLFMGGPAHSLFTLPTDLCRLPSLPASSRQIEAKKLALCKALYCVPFPHYTSKLDAMMHRAFSGTVGCGQDSKRPPSQYESTALRLEPASCSPGLSVANFVSHTFPEPVLARWGHCIAQRVKTCSLLAVSLIHGASVILTL